MIALTPFTIATSLLGVIFLLSVGANEVANILGAALGSKTLNLKKALVLVLLCECAGAVFGNGVISPLFREGIVKMTALHVDPNLLVICMLAILLAGSLWLLLGTILGLPVSVIHTLMSGLIGCCVFNFGFHAVHWGVVGSLLLGWLLAPIVSGLFAITLVSALQRSLFSDPHPFCMAKRCAPLLLLVFGFVFSGIAVFSSLDHWHYDFTARQQFLIALGTGLILMYGSRFLLKHVNFNLREGHVVEYQQTEKVFMVLVLFTTCAMLFSHGAMLLSNAVAPFAIAMDTLKAQQVVLATGLLPGWILVTGCLSVLLGLACFGRRVINTVGQGITNLTPSRAFVATLAAALTSVLAIGLAIPVSTTQIFVGAIVGAGIVRGLSAINIRVVCYIGLTWLLTLPIVALLSIVCFVGLKAWLL